MIYISLPFASSGFLFQVELYSQCFLNFIEALIRHWHLKLSWPVCYINYDHSKQYVQGWSSLRCATNYHAWLQFCPGSVESADCCTLLTPVWLLFVSVDDIALYGNKELCKLNVINIPCRRCISLYFVPNNCKILALYSFDYSVVYPSACLGCH